jgi:hypothetical protein
MTKRVNFRQTESARPARKFAMAIFPVFAVVAVCAVWTGFGFRQTEEAQFPAPVASVAVELQERIAGGISELREYLFP